MNKKIKCLVLSLFLYATTISIYAGELDKPYSPSRKEWLEVSIFKVIKDRTDAWKQRISSIVWVKDNAVFVTITSSNAEESLDQKAKNLYIDKIKADVQNYLKKYDWAKDLKVFVQFI